MTQKTFQVVVDRPMLIGECPLWHLGEMALYWVDIAGFAIHRHHPASGTQRTWRMPSEPAAIARCASGGLLVAMRSGFARLDTDTGEMREIAAAPYDISNMRFNDGRCDAQGRFWVGTMYEPRDQPLGKMVCLDHGTVRTVWEGDMTVSNGLAFSPDNRRMYHADTAAHSIFRRDFDLKTGRAGEAHVWKRFPDDRNSIDYIGRPDGAAVDREGAYWVAMFEGGRILRLSPDGDVLREIGLPLRCPTMVAFGGEDLRTLFITSASHNRSLEERSRLPLTGRVLALRVDVAGRVEPSYID